MKLDDLLEHIQSFRKVGEGNPEITTVENDHRNVTPGTLFVCIKGFTVDGHDLATEAVKAGAVAVVAEQPLELPVPVILVKSTLRSLPIIANIYYKQPTKSMQLIGVTGTNGKTTITQLLDAIFKDAGHKTGLIGTLHKRIGTEIIPTRNTTPDSLTTQKLFHQMKEGAVDTAIMEVSSHALELGRVHGCEFDIAVFTNLTIDHLDFHKTLDNYKIAKSLLFSQLGSDIDKKVAILNVDDEASAFYQMATQAQVLTYGIDKPADFTASEIKQSLAGTTFILHTPNGDFPIKTKFIGVFNVYNILAAIAVCAAVKMKIEEVIASIEAFPGVLGRFEQIKAGQDFSVVIDYSHTPDGLVNALTTIRALGPNRVHAIVGCGGDRDSSKRPVMAMLACDHSDYPIFTMDNPRTESQDQIFKDMELGVIGREYTIIADRKLAIEHAIKHAQPNDIILIAGKGHENYQIIGTERTHFDDREVAVEAIKKYCKL